MKKNSRALTYMMNAQEQSDYTDIYIDGHIGEEFDWASWEIINENTIQEFRKKLGEITTSNIRVWINSYGGDINHGLSIHDALKGHPAHVTTIAYGFVASAATVIHQAGDERLMSENSLYLPHRCMQRMFGFYNATELNDIIGDLEAIDRVIIKLYMNRCDRTEDQVKVLMDKANGNGAWHDSEQALEEGLIDRVYVAGEYENDPMVENMDEEEEEETAAVSNSKESSDPTPPQPSRFAAGAGAGLEIDPSLPPIPVKQAKNLVALRAAARARRLKLELIK